MSRMDTSLLPLLPKHAGAPLADTDVYVMLGHKLPRALTLQLFAGASAFPR